MKNKRIAPLEMDPEEFRMLGHHLVDNISDFLKNIRSKPVNTDDSPADYRRIVGNETLPQKGGDVKEFIDKSMEMLFNHSLFNGHPAFFGYITSSAAPLGSLAELLASNVNPNLGGYYLSPIATEIELQVIRWIAEMMNYPTDGGGILVSGGNMANFTGFLAGRKAKIPWDIREKGISEGNTNIAIYASVETHTWIQKAADLFGFGLNSIRYIPVDKYQRMRMDALEEQIYKDGKENIFQLMIIANAGTVSTGAVDPIRQIADIAERENMWMHVDGAYGGLAAVVADAHSELKHLNLADSLAIDPHKWLYAPLESGCTLVKKKEHLINAFSFKPPYYTMDVGAEQEPVYFHEYGMQNSRGFRALKIYWMMQQAGREGYEKMITEDIELAKLLFKEVKNEPEIEAYSQNLSITTFRYIPAGLKDTADKNMDYLNELNRQLMNRLNASGKAYISNAIVNDIFLLRACVVNFRTTEDEIKMLPKLIAQFGREIHQEISHNRVTTG